MTIKEAIERPITIEEAVTALRSLTDDDPETAHGEAEGVLLRVLARTKEGRAVAEAFIECRNRVGFWYL
jgi:hypothetical protein